MVILVFLFLAAIEALCSRLFIILFIEAQRSLQLCCMIWPQVTVGTQGNLVKLIQTPYVQLTGMPEGYSGEAIVVAENTPGEDSEDTPLKWSQSQVFFEFEFQHDPSFSIESHILIGWGLNLVSFGQVRRLPAPSIANHLPSFPGVLFSGCRGEPCAPTNANQSPQDLATALRLLLIFFWPFNSLAVLDPHRRRQHGPLWPCNHNHPGSCCSPGRSKDFSHHDLAGSLFLHLDCI